MTLTIADRSYELDKKKLKLKAIHALQSFKASEDYKDLLNLLSLIVNEPDVAFLDENVTLDHIEQMNTWVSSIGLK